MGRGSRGEGGHEGLEGWREGEGNEGSGGEFSETHLIIFLYIDAPGGCATILSNAECTSEKGVGGRREGWRLAAGGRDTY